MRRVAEAALQRIAEVNPKLNAIVHMDEEAVLRAAEELDRKHAAGARLGPLFGVPYTLKLLTAVRGSPGDQGLAPLAGTLDSADSVVARRLRDADGLFLGITNAPPAGFHGGGSENPVHGRTRNPWDLRHSPGGSSGGAAASVAAGVAPLAEGGDGAGSVRIPAALCGVVGFKPSTGRIPQQLTEGRFKGHVTHGPITRTVRDAALMLDVLVGESEVDPLSLPHDGRSYGDGLDAGVRGWRIAYSPDLGLGYEVDPQVARVCREAIDALARAGADIVEASPDLRGVEEAMWNGVWAPDYAALRSLFDWTAVGDRVDPRLRRLVREGCESRGALIAHADGLRAAAYRRFLEFMEGFDLLASPTVCATSFPVEQFTPAWLTGKELRRQVLGWLLTYPANLFAVPAISVPAGTSASGHPVGLQLMGGFRQDRRVLQAARALEQVRPWRATAPAIDHREPPGTAGARPERNADDIGDENAEKMREK